MKIPTFVVLGPPKENPNCFIVYDTVQMGSVPLDSYTDEYLTYEHAQKEADKRNNALAKDGYILKQGGE